MDGDPITIRDASEAEDPKLRAALEQLFQRKKSYEPIMELLAAHDMANQKSLVVLSQACLQRNPWTSVASSNLGTAFTNYYERHSVGQNILGEWGAMTSCMCQRLVEKLLFVRAIRRSSLDYWFQV